APRWWCGRDPSWATTSEQRHALGAEPGGVAAGFGPDDVRDGVDEGQVGERLGEVAEGAAAARGGFLGGERQGAGVRQQLLAQLPGPGDLADLDQGRDQPERADGEG